MLSKISQRETNTYMWNFKKPVVEGWLPRAGVWGKWGDDIHRVQTYI